MKKRYFVTGGAGFIGSNIVEELVRRKQPVRVFDNLSTGNFRNLKPFGNKLEFVKGDLRNLASLKKAMKGVTNVFHVGAIRAVERSVDDPSETDAVNVTGTLNVLMAARENGVKRVVFSSSSSVYGDSTKPKFSETDRPLPVSPYAASKLMGEYYCQIFSRLYGLETVSLRYFNVFGPRQNPESKYSAVIPILIFFLLKNKRPEIHWDGKQSRDFTYVDNIVSGNLLAMESAKANGQVINLACQEEYSVLDILNRLKKILNKPTLKPIFHPKRPGDVRRTFADIRKCKELLGFKPRTRFDDGLKKTADWFIESKVLEGIQL